jgi:Spy/CpxP family protein refolding chaperone
MRLWETTLRSGLWIAGLTVLFFPHLTLGQVERGNDVLQLIALLPPVQGARGPASPNPTTTGPQGTPEGAGRGGRGESPAAASQPSAAWWTDAALVARLGLTEDQKARIEAIVEQYRQTLVQNRTALEREEAALARMLEAEPMESVNAVSNQIERVIQARGEMERTNSKMTLEIRQTLTRAQWVQLQAETQPASSVTRGQRGRGGRRGGPVAPAAPPNP